MTELFDTIVFEKLVGNASTKMPAFGKFARIFLFEKIVFKKFARILFPKHFWFASRGGEGREMFGDLLKH